MPNQLPDTETAMEHLYEVDHRVFFNKLASHGIEPRTADEASQLLDLGYKLQAVQAQGQQKAASHNRFAEATQALDQLLGQSQDPEVKAAAQSRHNEQTYHQLAKQAASDETLRNAVLAVKAAQAAHLAQELGIQPQDANGESQAA